MPTVLTRPVSANLAACELTYLDRRPIDVEAARRQHAGYERALRAEGARVVRLPGDDALPDAVFVEDTAIVLDDLAVITAPGAESRHPETAAVASALAEFRPIAHLRPPARLDGGDVLRVGRMLYIGRSSRSNDEALDQLSRLVAPHDHVVMPVDVRGCLHLKTACTLAGPDLLLANPAWIDASVFRGLELLPVAPDEPWAGNVVRIRDAVITAAGAPMTRERLEARGIRTVAVDLSELQKAEAGPTCLSVIVEDIPPPEA